MVLFPPSFLPHRVSNLWEDSPLDAPAHLMGERVPSHSKLQRHHSSITASNARRPHISVKTDYPTNSYGYYHTDSSTEGRGGGYRLPRRTSDLAYSETGSLHKGRATSVDRNSYASSLSSFSGSLPDPGYNSRHSLALSESGYRAQSSESGYRGNPMVLLDTGTPNSSQSDFSSK